MGFPIRIFCAEKQPRQNALPWLMLFGKSGLEIGLLGPGGAVRNGSFFGGDFLGGLFCGSLFHGSFLGGSLFGLLGGDLVLGNEILFQ